MPWMVRAQIQLDERTYEALRRRAFEKGKSMSAVAREELAKALGVLRSSKRYSVKDFSWIGAGSSRKGPHNIAENHDEEYASAIEGHRRRRRR